MSESRAKRERKTQEPVVKNKKKNSGSIVFNLILVLIIVVVVGVGGYASYVKIQENIANAPQQTEQAQPTTVAEIAEQQGTAVDELMKKVGYEDKGLTGESSTDEFFQIMTIENFARYSDLEVSELKSMYGIENLENDMLWTEAQMNIKMKYVAETEYGISFEEFAMQYQLPAEITADMTQAEALSIMEAQQAAAQETESTEGESQVVAQ